MATVFKGYTGKSVQQRTCRRRDCSETFPAYPSDTKQYCCQKCHSLDREYPRAAETVPLLRREPLGRYINNGYLVLTGIYDHPLAHSNGVLSEHRRVLWEKLGCESRECEHECELCGRVLNWYGVDGICSDHENGDTLDNRSENLRVLCFGCNWNRI